MAPVNYNMDEREAANFSLHGGNQAVRVRLAYPSSLDGGGTRHYIFHRGQADGLGRARSSIVARHGWVPRRESLHSNRVPQLLAANGRRR